MSLIKYTAPSHLIQLYLAWQQNPRSTNHHLNFSYRIKDRNDVDLLIEKFQVLVKSKAYLRQTFAFEGEVLTATIHEDIDAEVNFITIDDADFPVLERSLISKAFNLSHKLAVRVTVVHNTTYDDYFVLFTTHHIIMDGVTLDGFIAELNRLLDKKEIVVETAKSYALQISHELVLKENSGEDFFVEYIDKIKKIDSEIEYPKTNEQSDVFHYTLKMPVALSEKLTRFSQQVTVSQFNLLVLAYTVFLARLMDQDKMLVNYPTNVRKDKSINGSFLNILVLPFCFDQELSYNGLLSRWREQIPSIKKIAKTRVDDQLALQRAPNFSSLTIDNLDDLVINGKSYTSISYPQIANGIISLKYREKNNNLYFVCDVLLDLFPKHFSDSILERFFLFLDRLLRQPEKKLSQLDLLFEEERKQLLVDFNQTDAPLPKHQVLIDWFDEIVQQYPEKIAVKAYNGQISYRELKQKAEIIAAYLIQHQVKLDQLVGILIDNRLEMIIAVIAVLKSGAAYVPIDHEIPSERIKSIIEDSEMRFLLSVPEFSDKINGNVELIDINQSFSNLPAYQRPPVEPTHLAYVIYTSGSTGRPKGVLIEHRSVTNYVNFLIKTNQLTCKTVGSKYIGFGFDISVSEIYPVLFSGGLLCIIENNDRFECDRINDFFTKNCVTYACLPTRMGEQFLQLKNKTLKVLGIGGEKINKFFPQNYRVVNIYGPTETTVQPTYFEISSQSDNIPIGKPIDNVKCFIVDRLFNLAPIGISGELYVSGVSVSRGYLRRDSLTKQQFINNPFVSSTGEMKHHAKLYKTGDLVRRLPSSDLEYMGRKDFQIKLLGHRIELEEIENILSRCAEIKQSVVALKVEDCRSYLVAYYTSSQTLEEKKLLDFLGCWLPNYMLPSLFVQVENFSLTLSGKLDREALPKPDLSHKNQHIPPQDEKQRLICRCFSELLGIDSVGINDDFFSLGGSSIQAISLASKLQQYFSVTIADIFNYKTPKKLSEEIYFSSKKLSDHLSVLKKNLVGVNKEEVFSERKLTNKISSYFFKISSMPSFYEESIGFNVIFLTGATGFLGCNLLYQLLQLTQYSVTLLVRATGLTEAFDRVASKFEFYFGQSLEMYVSRIRIITGDLSKTKLGLESDKYQELCGEVDAVIHAAALVNHYGRYEDFYFANVKATVNLLEFSLLTQGKNFHYISSCSVLNATHLDEDYAVFDEDDVMSSYTRSANLYIRTKQEGELLISDFRDRGVSVNIYRVGNLAFISKNGRLQKNKKENAFFNYILALFKLGAVAEELGTAELSPVDLTAKAIVLLFDKKKLQNQTFHVFNPRRYNIADFLLTCSDFFIKKLSFDDFISLLMRRLALMEQSCWLERFLLSQGWLKNDHIVDKTVEILQNKTHYILGCLGFTWSSLGTVSFEQYLRNFTVSLNQAET